MSAKSLFDAYLRELTRTTQSGDAREESYYGALEEMLRQMALATGRAHVRITTLPKPTEAGNPDLRLWNGADRIIGYVEVKRPTETNLDQVERSEQLLRYRGAFANLILTNLLEFRLYRDGALVSAVTLARPFVLNQLRAAPPAERVEELETLLDQFLGFSQPRPFSAASLAAELAKRTRYLRDAVAQQLAEELARDSGALAGFYEAFQTFLIGSLTPTAFADLYAQTITYGLFAARTRADNGFTRRAAFDNIPRTIGILRDVFRFISLGDLPAALEWIVDDIAEVLAVADAPGILDSYYREGRGSDPIVHFYETFLAHYDPEERERRGVYYTPEPVVSYIVRSLHRILQDEFGLADGLASQGVTLLDPAAGTMTFVAQAAQVAVGEFERKYGGGAREQFIRDHVLRNFNAFELMMAPYAVGHLKMSFLLQELGYRMADDERMPLYLTNTLDREDLKGSRMPLFFSLAEESRLAGHVKRQTPILVMLGNPPYSGISSNMSEWITGLIEDYKYVEGQHFGERKHWLQDDYVKFLRFAEWKIAQAGRGVVGMITNHGYLDNPTFRGMRWHLMQTYDEIRVLDLHGNSLKRETCPDGSPDENVFDIRAGVAIVFFIKRGNGRAPAKVYHAERWGTREDKYDWLSAHDVTDTRWAELDPVSRFFFFVPRDESGAPAYQKMVPVTRLFPVHVTGIVTARDKLVIGFDPDSVLRTVRPLTDKTLSDEYVMEYLRIVLGRKEVSQVENYAWRLSEARSLLQKLESLETYMVPVLYRPFDVRSIFLHSSLVWRDRREVMRHMLAGDNLALVTARTNRSPTMDHFFCSEHITEAKSGESTIQSYTFPLYLYPDGGRKDLFAGQEGYERRPNLDAGVVQALAQAHGIAPAPEALFYYVYALLYAPTYRETYAPFLRMDFPRIPFTADAALFAELAALGERLAGLHLLKSPDLSAPTAQFHGPGDNRVGRAGRQGLRYDAEEQRVYINPGQYFAPVHPAVWAYQIGGYQVCDKWLKDRRERALSLDEIRAYCRIVTALGRTIALQEQIDALYPQVEETLLGGG